ncbi:nuclear transport factor 2 family protein [Parasphingorhabdus sp.]|uniref:nuclear transport factor 2 family protein n=1 Tax=Parasphingorhabdus sp. TaxID=2709688 RepID=UPI003265F946
MTDSPKSRNHQLVEQWCERVWRQRDASAMDDLFEPTGTATGLGRETRTGPEQMRGFHSAICDLLADTRMELDTVLEQDGKLACLCTFHGTCKRSGDKVETPGAMFFEFSDDKIVKGVNRFEFMEMFEQLGLLPEHSFAKALGGNVVA